MAFFWFYLFLPVLIGCIVLPILLYRQTRKLPWLVIAFAKFSPLLFLIPVLSRTTWIGGLYPVAYIDESGVRNMHTVTDWPGLIMILAFVWFYLDNKKKKIEPFDLPKPAQGVD